MSEIERDEMEVGVLFVGGGPANLAGAIRLMDLIEEHNGKIEAGEIEGEPIDVDELPVMIIEKGGQVGDQILSGACIDTRAFDELFDPAFLAENPPPFDSPVLEDHLVILTPAGAQGAPILPPTFHNHGNQLASLNRVTQWMAEVAEEKGVMIMPEFPGADLLYEDGRVIGVRTGDKGIDKHGKQRPNFEPGTDIQAALTVLGEGARGSLTKLLIANHKLDADSNHQIYSTGVKELWKVLPGRIEPGTVIHTAGYPLSLDTFGGGFIYGLQDGYVSLGLVTALDSPDPYLDPHRKFSEWKQHPFVKAILEGGTMERYGAKTIPEGGWFSMPRCYAPGALLVGDSAGVLNISRLKGIHLAMKSGMLAAETAFEILRDGKTATEEVTRRYEDRILRSWIYEELWPVRNFRQGFQRKLLGILPEMFTGTLYAGLGFASASAMLLAAAVLCLLGHGLLAWIFLGTGLFLFGASFPMGAFPLGRMSMLPDHARIRKINIRGWQRKSSASDPVPAARLPGISAAADQVKWNAEHPAALAPSSPLDPEAPAMSIPSSGGIVFDKLTAVYKAGSIHEEDQPAHLVVASPDVCHTRCTEEYGNPCQYFCPANVYEMVEADGGKGRKLFLNFSNCVHCKTCDVRDPYQIITWVPPEGGGGPSYVGL